MTRRRRMTLSSSSSSFCLGYHCLLVALLLLCACASALDKDVPKGRIQQQQDGRGLVPAAAAAAADARPQPKIVGGQMADPAIYPFYVVTIGADELCGGTLIAPDFVLTAAHCTGAFTADVLVGAHDGMNNDDKALAQLAVLVTIPHPEYTPGTEDNDIMLVQLAEPVTNNSTEDEDVALVELNWDPALPVDGITVLTIGFGQTVENGDVSDDLLQVALDNVGWETCGGLLPGIKPFHVCAGVPKGGADSCGGDSGGPILDGSNHQIQYGVVSFGYGCGRELSPGVNTRVSWYQEWITTMVCTKSVRPPDSFNCPQSEGISSDRQPQVTETPSAAPSVLASAMPTLSPTNTTTAPPTVLATEAVDTTEDDEQRQTNNTATLMPVFIEGNLTTDTGNDIPPEIVFGNLTTPNATDSPTLDASAVPTVAPPSPPNMTTAAPTTAAPTTLIPTTAAPMTLAPTKPATTPAPTTMNPTAATTLAPTSSATQDRSSTTSSASSRRAAGGTTLMTTTILVACITTTLQLVMFSGR